MRVYEITYPDEHNNDIVEILTEQEIIDQYYKYWCSKMIQNVPNADLSIENCIYDWCVIHWAAIIEIPV